MESAPWLFPLLGALASGVIAAFGAWVAVKVTVARLEVYMTDTRERVNRHARRLAVLNDDSLTHDIELGIAFEKLQIKRANRQRLRDRISTE